MKINVLDKGYVRLVDTLGNDLSVVNAARVSYDKESSELSDKDAGLLRFLASHGHSSPFRHAALTFECYAPLLIARQWYKHAVASTHLDDQSGWNESSRRYVTETPEFYVPTEWRRAPAYKKQGSGEPVSAVYGEWLTTELVKYVEQGLALYESAMQGGVAPEQARLFLPAYGLYVRWRWTPSLHAALNFIDLRLHGDAQSEIQQYAQAVSEIILQQFPACYEAWKGTR